VIVSQYHNLIDSTIKSILQKNIYTPQPEPEFLLRYEPLPRLNVAAGFHLVFIIGTIEDEPIRKIVGKRLAEIEKDTFRLLAIPEPWAKNQKVLVFVTQHKSQLVAGLTKYAERIRYTFQQYALEQIKRITYQRSFNKRLKKKVLANYGFAFDLPFGFKMVDKYEFDNFIYFVTHNPDRSIFCYYEDGIKPLLKDNLLAFRDSLTAQFYEGDFVVKELTTMDTVQFMLLSKNFQPAGQPSKEIKPVELKGDKKEVFAVKIKGVWQNNQLNAGGPFLSYCFNYQNRFYYIDGMVFNPGKYKLDNQNQMDVILQTFELK